MYAIMEKNEPRNVYYQGTKEAWKKNLQFFLGKDLNAIFILEQLSLVFTFGHFLNLIYTL